MKEQPLFFAAKELFGSYVNAVKQAGINYWQIVQHVVWSTLDNPPLTPAPSAVILPRW